MIDYLSQRKSTENALGNLVSGRNVDDELSRSQKNLQELKGRFSERANAIISSNSPSGRSSINSRQNEIDPAMRVLIARKKMDLQKQKSEAIFNNAFNMAQEYGMDEKTATEYARRISGQAIEQNYGASEAEKSRAYKQRLNALAGENSISEQGLYNEFSGRQDMAPQLVGAGIGVAASAGTDAWLRKKYLEDLNYKPVSGSVPSSKTSLRSGSSFSTPIDTYGRRV